MPLTNASALAILHEEAANAFAGNTNPSWDTAIDELSALSNRVGVYTHIAFLGTAILAKATDSNVDVYSVKQTGKSGSYSARNLAHGVLV